jgi:hypothetical protein
MLKVYWKDICPFLLFLLTMTWLCIVWTNMWKICIQVLVHTWQGFMLKRRSVELSPESSPVRPQVRPDRTPGRSIRWGTEPLYWRMFRPGAETLWRAARRLVSSPVPPDWPLGRPAHSPTAPNLSLNDVPSCFQRPDFHPHINTPSSSWGRVRTSPTIVHLWSSHLPPLQKHQIP